MKTLLAAFTALFTLTGCVNLEPTPDPTRYFNLTPMAVGNATSAKPTMAIVIQPVSVPDYLKRSNIVQRKDLGELTFSEFDRWAEPVENAIARVIAVNLSSLLNSRFIRTSDQLGGHDGELKLTLTVVEFTTATNGAALFTVETKLMAVDGVGIIAATRSRLTTPPADGTFDMSANVNALSETLKQFSEQLAAQLSQFN